MVEGTDTGCAICTVWKVEDVIINRAKSIHGQPDSTFAGKGIPARTVREAFLQPTVCNLPVADQPLPVLIVGEGAHLLISRVSQQTVGLWC